MNGHLVINHEKRTITMSRTFAEGAKNVGSQEYAALRNCKRDFPEYEILTRHIKRNSNKECYRGLTYEYMRQYIAYFDENVNEAMNEFNEKIIISECHSKRYPVVKDWFLEKYPKVKEFGMPKLAEMATKQLGASAQFALPSPEEVAA